MKNKRSKRNQNGITLVALVITVIVLLILAGTSISIAINGSNLFSKTSQSRDAWDNSVAKENLSIKNYLTYLDTYDDSPIDESSKLKAYFSQDDWNDIYDEENHCYKDNDFIGIIGSYIHQINSSSFLIFYNGGIYSIKQDNDTMQLNVQLERYFNNMEEYVNEFDEHYLITPSTPDNPLHSVYSGPYTLSDNMYFLNANDDLCLSKTYYIMEDNDYGTIIHNYYDNSGIFINSTYYPQLSQIEVDGPTDFSNLRYSSDDKPFSRGYHSFENGNYYDESGKLVEVYIDFQTL